MPRDEFGDFQTPVGLVKQVYDHVVGSEFHRILEPTCGVGNFLHGAREAIPAAERIGVEAQNVYAQSAEKLGRIYHADAMRIDFGRDIEWKTRGRLLVVGNPPWVTNADLTAMDSNNKPKLKNIRNLRGIDAITGASNFDIAEAIMLKLMGELADERPTFAMLCKTQVARNVISYAAQFGLPFAKGRIHMIDAQKWFKAAVDACLFSFELEGEPDYTAEVYESLTASEGVRRVGVVDGKLVSNVSEYVHTRSADGKSPVEWRQGIKHDATKVMELVESSGPRTKEGEVVHIEDDYLYPLFKCSDVFRGRTRHLDKMMVVPQQHTGDDTKLLEHTAPLLWDYLTKNGSALDGRKSSIYRNRARFCIFGVGPYSFAPYKVAVSAMHKEPVFRLVGLIIGKPAVFDDVTYFASFDNAADAAVFCATLRSNAAQALIDSLIFTDSKRPITKKLLQRVDTRELARLADQEEVIRTAAALLTDIGDSLGQAELSDAFARLVQAERVDDAADELALF